MEQFSHTHLPIYFLQSSSKIELKFAPQAAPQPPNLKYYLPVHSKYSFKTQI